MKLNLTFLGTASAVPTPKRNHSGIFFSYGSENILFDCGEGIQRQFKIARLNPCKLTKIFISHWHGDHTLGLPGLIQTLRMSGYAKTLQIYGPKGTKKKIELMQEIYGHFYEKENPQTKLEINEISSGKIINEKDFEIHSAAMSHTASTLAYSFIIKDKLKIDKKKLEKLNMPNSPILANLQKGKDIIHPITKKRILAKKLVYKENGKKLTYIPDTSPNKSSIRLAKNSDILISESSYSEDQKDLAKEKKHLTAKQAATIAKQSKSKKLYLTHISQRYEHNLKKILAEAQKTFKNTQIAKDFEKISL